MYRVKFILLCGVMSGCLVPASAYDFESEGLCYNILPSDEKTCEVTYRTSSYNSYSGDVTVPEKVTHGGETYIVTHIGDNAFRDCDSLFSVVVGNSVTTVGDYAFRNSSLRSLTLGAGVLSVGSGTFYGCGRLLKLFLLPNTVPSGLASAFETLDGRVTYVSNDSYTSSVYGDIRTYKFLSSMFTEDGVKYLVVSPSERTCDVVDCVYGGVGSALQVKATVAHQGVELSVKDICQNAFYGCAALETATLSNTGDIGDCAFSGCAALETATLSNSGNIGGLAFYDCTSLKTATLSNSGDIGDFAFYGCTALETAQMKGSGAASIGVSCFASCGNLHEVTLPDSLETVGDYAFDGCGRLTAIGTHAFEETSLASLDIPASVTSIGNGAFRGCKSLARVTFSNGRKTLKLGDNGNNSGEGLFHDCPLEELVIGRDLAYPTSSDRGYSPFYRSPTLRKVTMTDMPREVFANEFYGCTALTDVSMGDGVTAIGDYAFSGCNRIERFTFGEGLRSIGREAFSDCVSIVELVAEATVPPSCGSQALDDLNKWSCKLYVLPSSVSAYKEAAQWSEFFFVEQLAIVDRRVYIHFLDGSFVTVNFSASPKLDFSGDEVILTSSAGGETWAFETVRKLTFGRQYGVGEHTGVESAAAEERLSFRLTAEGLSVSGAGGETLRVSDLSGRVCLIRRMESAEERVSLSGLPAGVYVVSAGGKSVKIAKK